MPGQPIRLRARLARIEVSSVSVEVRLSLDSDPPPGLLQHVGGAFSILMLADDDDAAEAAEPWASER